jgi:hypothetical protein
MIVLFLLPVPQPIALCLRADPEIVSVSGGARRTINFSKHHELRIFCPIVPGGGKNRFITIWRGGLICEGENVVFSDAAGIGFSCVVRRVR